eukprot:TRINITY_DN12970_c0_g1_i1.p1 TRINITY_DN12970_c0_g1~~TRINITY_DN12970_c0_g1_i1.p1  ORF type:complete len:987 (+),score=246.26 TRINITY_DN12970_c0_g1_i1:153-3113(+)
MIGAHKSPGGSGVHIMGVSSPVYVAIAVALAAGLAAGTAAAVSSSALPYMLGVAVAALRQKRKKEHREHRHRHKSEKLRKVASTLPKEGLLYKDVILKQGLVDWRDIDVTFENFPYYLSESVRTALLDSVYIHVKRPDFAKYTTELTTISPRMLLSGPPGTELYQETLVKALARHLQAKLLVFDSTLVCLEVNDSLPLTTAPQQKQEETPLKESTSEDSEQVLDAGGSTDLKDVAAAVVTSPPLTNEGKARDAAKMARGRLGAGKGDDVSVAPSLPHVPSLGTIRSKPRPENGADTRGMAAAFLAAAEAARRPLKKGDRVKYVGSNGSMSGMGTFGPQPSAAVYIVEGSRRMVDPFMNSRGPPVGCKGRVLMVLEDNPNKVGVRFDKPVYGGNNLVDMCEDGHGFFCNVSELRHEGSAEDADKLVIDALLEVLNSAEMSQEPLILFIRNMERTIMGNFERYMKLERLEKSNPRVIIVGSHTASERKEKPSAAALGPRNGNSLSALLDLSFLDQLTSRGEDYRAEVPKTSKMIAKLFPSKVCIQPPQEDKQLADWSRQIEQDTETLKAESNRQRLRTVLGAANVECEGLSDISVTYQLLSQENVEKIVGWGASYHLQNNSEPVLKNAKLVINSESLQHGVDTLRAISRSATGLKKRLKDIVPENEFEKILLSEVVPPDELGVTFDHIGALENVKETLRELVMLPLQRPELFVRGQLTKPCRGLLLFGPPGTGKTMLAKAVATEAGANFINISMSTIASKWFGEAEKYVKAVFSLASKIAPTVIFIDEVDSMLGRRGKDNEHSAMRKIKNEFMASWDGLRTRETERVLVLAATNRPFDLDEAVIRRFPRRLMVDLPDSENRAKILKVILAEEDLAEEFNVEELAAATDSYSGSDLRNLCTTAAYRRIREILDKEKKEKEKAKVEGREWQPQETSPDFRPIDMEDMRQAMALVRSSVAQEAGSMLELQQWNDQYGEGGSGKKATLSYFM